MRPEEIAIIQAKQRAAIVAPAGHGKTEEDQEERVKNIADAIFFAPDVFAAGRL